MLIGHDELFRHQVSLPHAMVGSSDPSWRERYWVSFQDVEAGDTVLTLGLGQYPNQDVQEAFACLAHGGRQRNVRLSRRLSSAPEDTAVGPLSVEVKEPYRCLRFVLDDNDSGLSFDLEWLAELDPILEDRHVETAGTRITHDLTRYVQLGRGRGTIRAEGEKLTVVPERWYGERDHSWGLRPLPAVDGAPPAPRPDWSFLLFLPVQTADLGFHLYLFEDGAGHPTHLSCGVVGPDGAWDDIAVSVAHDLSWERSAPTPTLIGGEVRVQFRSGRTLPLELRAKPGRAYLRGGGFGGYQGWFQGHWKGESSIEHEVWDLTEADKLGSRGRYSSDHLVEVRVDGQVGYGIAEYMVLPGHERYGHVRD